jgi:hypothetical protein
MIAGNSAKVILPERVSGYIKLGLLTANLFVTSRGTDTWYRPTAPAGALDSYDSYTIAEWMDNHPLDKDQNSVLGSLSGESALYEPGELSDSSDYENDVREMGKERAELVSRGPVPIPKSLEEAERLYARYDLGRYRKQGILQTASLDSLEPRDFKRETCFLAARAIVVANHIGTAKAWGMVGNQLDGHGSSTISEWWRKTSDEDRLAVLTRKKKFPDSARKGLPLHKLNYVGCPFPRTVLLAPSGSSAVKH